MKRVLAIILVLFSSLAQSATTTQVGPIVSNVVTELTDAATVTWDATTAFAFKVTLGGSRTVSNPTGQVAGSLYTLNVIQDGTGSRLITWGSAFKYAGGTAPVLSTGAGMSDVILFYSDGTYLTVLSITKDVVSPIPAPSNLVATPGATNCVLTWEDNSSDETGFEVQADYSASGAAWGAITTTAPNAETFDDTALDPGTYWYRVRAKRGSQYSPYNSETEVVCIVLGGGSFMGFPGFVPT